MEMKQSLNLLVAACSLSLFAACGSQQEAKEAEQPSATDDAPPEEASQSAVAGEQAQMETADEKISYAIGYQMAERYSNDGVLSLDRELLIQGVSDALDGKDSMVSQAEAQAAGMELQQRMQSQQSAAGAQAKSEGEAFLAANKEKPNVVTTESGLQYEILEEGDSNESPEATDTVTVHYHGTLTDGTVFDSSVQRGQPASFPLNGVIRGWTEGLQYMSVGDKYRFYIPSDLAYGPRGQGQIPANSVLIFDVDLLGIEGGETE